jgi:hypothetical protein
MIGRRMGIQKSMGPSILLTNLAPEAGKKLAVKKESL